MINMFFKIFPHVSCFVIFMGMIFCMLVGNWLASLWAFVAYLWCKNFYNTMEFIRLFEELTETKDNNKTVEKKI